MSRLRRRFCISVTALPSWREMTTPMSPEQTIDVFLCHTGANKQWTEDLAKRLEKEKVEDRQLRVFFDAWDIGYGENILARIEDGLRRSRFLAVVLSPALTRAAWPTLEWQTQVYDDPSGKKGRILCMLLEKFDPTTLEPLDIPLPLRILKFFDFSDKIRQGAEYQRLVWRIQGKPLERGRPTLGETMSAIGVVSGPEAAEPIEELLLGNLFPTSELPSYIYSDLTTAQKGYEVKQALLPPVRPPFILHSERLYSFIAPETADNPFRRFLTGTDPLRESVEDWLADPVKAPRLIWLCNNALRELCYALRLYHPAGDKNQFYPPISDGQPRKFTWGSGRAITLAKVAEKDGKRLGVHHSARLRFIMMNKRPHLLIEPGWFFTTNGTTPQEGRQLGVLSVRWGGREGNDTVLRHTLMWVRLLATGQTTIAITVGGDSRIRLAPTPIYGRVNHGIYEDTIALERLLEGEGAGEIGTGLGDEDLDKIAAARDAGLLEEEEPQVPDKAPEPEDPTTSEPELL
jgi:hypothetical protein